MPQREELKIDLSSVWKKLCWGMKSTHSRQKHIRCVVCKSSNIQQEEARLLRGRCTRKRLKNKDAGINLDTQYIKQITNKDLLYSTGNYTQYFAIAYKRKESEKIGICVCITESLFCILEHTIVNQLYFNFKKREKNMEFWTCHLDEIGLFSYLNFKSICYHLTSFQSQSRKDAY